MDVLFVWRNKLNYLGVWEILLGIEDATPQSLVELEKIINPRLILEVQKHLKHCLHLVIQNYIHHWEDATRDMPDLIDMHGKG